MARVLESVYCAAQGAVCVGTAGAGSGVGTGSGAGVGSGAGAGSGAGMGAHQRKSGCPSSRASSPRHSSSTRASGCAGSGTVSVTTWRRKAGLRRSRSLGPAGSGKMP